MIGTHLLGVVEEISLKQNTKQRRGEDTDHLFLPPLLDPLQLLTREAKDPRGQNIHTREEEGMRRCLLLFQIIPLMIMEDIKEQDYLHRLQKFWVLCNLLGLWIRHHLYIWIMWCNNQGTQVLNQIRKPSPLTGLLMRCLDCFLKSYVQTDRGKYSYKATIRNRAFDGESRVSINDTSTV